MSVMDLIVPFLQLRQSIVIPLGEWVDGSWVGEADILKFPPTKNWRAIVADWYLLQGSSTEWV